MSNYTKTTDFEAKDSLPSGDSGKIIKGAEFETEFDAISTAVATKADAAGATLTGTTSFENLSDGTITVTAFVDEDNMASDSATLVPTQQSVKAYVDSQVTAQDLDFQADSGGALSIDLDSEALTLTGGTGIDTSGALNEVTFAIDSTVATLTGTQTLTNKTLTAPTISGNLTTDGNIDGRDVATDGVKLDGIEANATADQTAAEIRTLVDSATDSNVFTDADHTKLDGIEASATADQTDAEIRAAVEAATDSNVFTDADHTKLDGIEASADVTDTANVTAAGALMDSEVTNLAQVKAFDSADYATAAQGSTADSALQNVVEDTTPQLGGDLASNGNDILFADSDKAIFGAGSDLQIYHSGSASIIGDFGTGDLLVRGENLKLQNTAGENYLVATNNDATRLYHDSAEKLATTSTGIDVTGTVTADGLTVDGDGATVASVNATTGTGVVGLKVNNTGGNTFLGISNSAGGGYLSSIGNYATALVTESATNLALGTNNAKRLLIGSGGDISFYEDTGTTAKLFWDASAESLGIGTSSPDRQLNVVGNNTVVAEFENTNASGNARIYVTAGTASGILSQYGQSHATLANVTQLSSPSETRLVNGGVTVATLKSTGNVGIGTSSPSSPLEVAGGSAYPTTKFSRDGGSAATQGYLTTGFSAIGYSGGTGADAYLVAEHGFGFAVNAGTNALVITDGGNVGIGTSSPNYKLETKDGDIAVVKLEAAAGGNSVNGIRFRVNNSANTAQSATLGMVNAETVNSWGGVLTFSTKPANGTPNESVTERMRIDSSGNLLVGVTSAQDFTSTTTNGHTLYGGTANVALHSRSGANALAVQRTTNDGALVNFFKDTAAVGSIGADNASINIGSGNTGLLFYNTATAIYPRTAAGAQSNGAINLGGASDRFKDLHMSGNAFIDGNVQVAAGNGILLGGTDTANKLDDYEEGTFTVTFPSGVTSPTYVIQDGSYVKIGKLVTFQIRMELSAGTANGSHIKIGGLPFTSTSASSYGGAFFNYSQGFITDIGARTMHIGSNGTLISFYKTDGGQLAGTDVDDLTSTLLINGQYEVA